MEKLKSIDFYNLLKAGYRIRIENDGTHTQGYTPTDFFIKGSDLYFENKDVNIFGAERHPTFTGMPTKFNNHIKKMLSQKFKVTIPYNN